MALTLFCTARLKASSATGEVTKTFLATNEFDCGTKAWAAVMETDVFMDIRIDAAIGSSDSSEAMKSVEEARIIL